MKKCLLFSSLFWLIFVICHAQEEDVESLLEKLNSDDLKVREDATDVLLKRESWTEKELELLKKASEDDDAEVAKRAQIVLERISIRQELGAKLLTAVSQIDQILHTGTETEKLNILERVDEMVQKKKLDKENISGLLELIRSWKLENPKRVLEVVTDKRIKIGALLLIKMLKEGDNDLRRRAVFFLDILDAKEYASDIVELLKDEDLEVRLAAVDALHCLRPTGHAAEIVPLLSHEKAGVRRAAVEVLGYLNARQYVKEIASLLKDENDLVRRDAIQSLSYLDAIEYTKEIAAMLKDSSDEVRSTSAWVLGMLQAKQYAGDIANLLKDDEHKVREYAAIALANLKAKEHVKEIATLLQDEIPWVQETAVECLGVLGGKQYIEDIARLLKEGKYGSSKAIAAEALGKLHAKQYVKEIAPLLKDEDNVARGKAAIALGRLQAAEAIDDLTKLSKQESAWGDHLFASISLIRLGSAKANRAIVEDVLRQNFTELQKYMLETLTIEEQPQVWEMLTTKQIEFKEDVNSMDKLKKAFASEGYALECQDEPVIPVNFTKGEKVTVYTLLDINTGYSLLGLATDYTYGFVVDGNKIKIMALEESLKWWIKRLE